MNSTPAISKARRTARSLAAVMDVSPSANSARRIVATPTAVEPDLVELRFGDKADSLPFEGLLDYHDDGEIALHHPLALFNSRDRQMTDGAVGPPNKAACAGSFANR